MANTIQIKRKTTTGAPALGSLSDGEFCLNTVDNLLYVRVNGTTLLEIDPALLSLFSDDGAGNMVVTNNLFIDPSGSTNAFPALMGVNGWELTEAARFIFGDVYNMIQSGNGDMMDFVSYNPIRIVGGRNTLDGGLPIGLASTETNGAVIIPNYNPSRSALLIRAAGSQTGSLLRLEDSTSALLSEINASGQWDGDVVYDNATSGLTATTMQAAIDEVEARVDTNDAKTGITSAEQTKLGHITVSQAVDLDTMESNIATNNAKVSADGSITSHSDVVITTPSTGQVLEYNGTNWVNATATGGSSPTTGTGSTLDISNTMGTYYNMAGGTITTTFTVTGGVLGGWAKVYINGSATEPTVTGATKLKGATYDSANDYYLIVEYNGVRYDYFLVQADNN